MPRYRVRALSPDGQTHREVIDAPSIDAAVAEFTARELDVQSVELADVTPHRSEPAGLLPPEPPREVPPGVTGTAGGVVLIAVGAVFVVVASIFIVIGIGLLAAGREGGLFMTLFPMIHFTIGAGLLAFALRARRKRRTLYRTGLATLAIVDRVGFNRSVRVNGRNPHEIGWTFHVDDQPRHGKRSTMNQAARTLVEGDRIWVLYDPADPTESVEWPPL